MRLFPFLKRRTESTQTVAVCDIGGGSVAVGIVEVHHGESPFARVLVSERRALGFSGKERGEKQSAEQLKTLLQETATAVLGKHISVGNTAPRSVSCVVHGPWVRTEASHANHHFERGTVITANLIRDLAQEAAQQKTTLTEENIFERVVTRVLLNGYWAKKPEGKQAARIAVSVLQSDMNPLMKRALEDVLSAVFPGRTSTYHSAPLVLGIVVDEYAPALSQYTLVDVTSSTTDATVIRSGSPHAHGSAALGWRTIIETLSAIEGTVADDMLSRARMIAEGICSDATCAQILDALKKAEPKFVDAYGKMLDALAKSGRVPDAMLLVAPPEVGAWFADVLARVDFAQFTTAERPFVVDQLFPHYLERGVVFNAGLQPDTGIAAAAGFVHIRARDSSSGSSS